MAALQQQQQPSRTVSPTDINSTIYLARRGESIDWTLAKQEFNERLQDLFSQWSDIDPASFTDQISEFPDPPHTIQRLAQLLDDPHRWYTSADKFARAISKVLSVTSTTLDFAAEKEKDKLLPTSTYDRDESLLVPIPWLRHLSIDELEDPVARTTAMPNGVTITVNGHIEEHMEDTERVGQSVVAPLTGSAPIDAADYGPQSNAVQETIASSGSIGPIDALPDDSMMPGS